MIRAKKQQGEFLSNYAPYGYRKDPANKNRLVVDEDSAAIVRNIFEMCKSGMGSKNIAKSLNKADVLTPLNYRQQVFGELLGRNSRGWWQAETIISILRNRVYLGATVQGIYDCARFKRTPNKRKAKEDWIITPNTHEAIVDCEIWEIAQKRIDARKRIIEKRHVQIFAGFVKCEDCGYALSYANTHGTEQYTCGQYRRYGTDLCSSHYIRKELLEQAVLDDIRKYAKLAKDKNIDLANQLHALNGGQTQKQLKSLNFELRNHLKRCNELDEIIRRLYEDNVNGKLSDERFGKLLTGYESEQAAIKAKTEELEKAIAEIESNKIDSTAWVKIIKNYSTIKELDRDILSELIDKITVGETKIVNGEKEVDITIYYRFVGAIG